MPSWFLNWLDATIGSLDVPRGLATAVASGVKADLEAEMKALYAEWETQVRPHPNHTAEYEVFVRSTFGVT